MERTSSRHRTDIPLLSFTPTDVDFTWDLEEECFRHQYDRDLQLVVLWSYARTHEDEILAMIAAHFAILGEYAIRWQPERMAHNFERFYARPIRGRFHKHDQVGDGELLAVVVEDPSPRYGYRTNVSGLVELTNLAIAEAKAAARARTGGYHIHSSNNLSEFFRDTTLLLGPERVNKLIRGAASSGERESYEADLVGSEGWHGVDELLATLRYTSGYVVLRSDEQLLDGSLKPGDDVDVLCGQALEFAAAANAPRYYARADSARYATVVAGEPFHFDVREIGDGYLDAQWQRDILRRRGWRGGIPVPRVDDHFFSLLYHTRIQKPAVKPAHARTLASLAPRIGLKVDIDERAGISDDQAAPLLDGYLRAYGYAVPQPTDRHVHRNQPFTRHLTLTRIEEPPVTAAMRQLWSEARRSRLVRRLTRSRVTASVYRRVRSALRASR